MADRTGLIPFVLRERKDGRDVPYAPLTTAGQVLMPDGVPLADYLAASAPDWPLVTIRHDLGEYPDVLLLMGECTAVQAGRGMARRAAPSWYNAPAARVIRMPIP